jgi:hypothetical protein
MTVVLRAYKGSKRGLKRLKKGVKNRVVLAPKKHCKDRIKKLWPV